MINSDSASITAELLRAEFRYNRERHEETNKNLQKIVVQNALTQIKIENTEKVISETHDMAKNTQEIAQELKVAIYGSSEKNEQGIKKIVDTLQTDFIRRIIRRRVTKRIAIAFFTISGSIVSWLLTHAGK